MKKMVACLLTGLMLLVVIAPASAHEGRGPYSGVHGGTWRGGWIPFAVGAVAGIAVANTYYRPAPIYYTPQYIYPPQPQTAAYCPENGLYYPQAQACPSGWQRVNY